MSAFHMAFRIDEIESTRQFYGELLQCSQGRESATWIDFDFFGNQISAHLGARPDWKLETMVDDTAVPLNHFGAVISWSEWERLHQRLQVAGVPFILEPQVRFVGMPGEQATFFVSDPSGNALEFKAYRHEDAVFKR
ncbi:VOC family protein [Lichenicola cladoniae]|nr:VOC family protein [Lichenicola cladoniae]